MDDTKFVHLLLQLVNNPYYEYDEEQSGVLTQDRASIVDAVITCAHVAGYSLDGYTSAAGCGAKEVRKKYKAIFDKNGHPIGSGGKQKAGNKAPDREQRKKIKEASELIKKGISQEAACDRSGIKPSTYRRCRKNYPQWNLASPKKP